MQPQPVQNMFISSNAGANNSASIRSNHPNGIFRHSASTQRNRFMFPTALQSVVLPQYSFPRQAQYQQFPYGPQYYPSVQNTVQNYYPLYHFQQTPPQRPPAFGISTNMGFNNAIPVQSGTIPGPSSSNQSQISLGATQVAASVLGPGSTSSITVPPIISVMQTSNTATKKPRTYALEIIDPTTKRNILDDLEMPKVAPPVERHCQELILPSLTHGSDFDLQKSDKNIFSDEHFQYVDKIDTTPVVSALTNAPSVEIYPIKDCKHKILFGKLVENKVESNHVIMDGSDQCDDLLPTFSNVKSIATNCSNNQLLETVSNKSCNQTKDLMQKSLDDKHYDQITLDNSALKELDDYQTECCRFEVDQISYSCKQQEALNETKQTEIVDMKEKEINFVACAPLADEIQTAQHAVKYLSNTPTTITTTFKTNSEVSCIENKQFKDPLIDNDLCHNGIKGNEHIIRNTYNESCIGNKYDAHFSNESPLKEIVPDKQFEQKNHLSSGKVEMQTFTEEPKIFAESTTSALQMCISYNKGQWSPSNPGGKKTYNKDQLLKLREAEASKMQPDVKHNSILPGYNLLPAFALNTSNKKILSMTGACVNRCSDGSYQNNFAKQTSISIGGRVVGNQSRDSSKPMIHVNLSLNQDVKLNETANAWRPRILEKKNEYDNQDKEELVRSVRGILNKLTPERFTPLLNEILNLNIDTNEKRDIVMLMVFEKAIDEPNFSVSYANLCQSLISNAKNSKQFFTSFLDKMRAEFRCNVINIKNKEEKLKPIKEKIKNSKDTLEKVELEALLEEKIQKIRRRSSGNVRFIGELFNINVLSGKTINNYIEDLLKQSNNEDILECLCKLLTTVGEKFEKTLMQPKTYFSLQNVITRMKALTTKNKNSKISSRVRFMLQDVIDLRANKWQCTRIETPTTLQEIEKEAQKEHLTQHLNNYYIPFPNNGHIKRDNRHGENRLNYVGSHSQRGETNSTKRNHHAGNGFGSQSIGGNCSIDDTWQVQSSKGNRLDFNKLESIHSFDGSNRTMGGVQQFQWDKCFNSFAALSVSEVNSNCANTNDKEKNRTREKKGQVRTSGDVERDNPPITNDSTKKNYRGNIHFPAHDSSINLSNTSYGIKPIDISEEFTESTSSLNFRKESAQISNLPNDISPNATFPVMNMFDNFDRLTEKEIILLRSIAHEMIENAENLKNNCKIEYDTISCIERISESQRCSFLYYILTRYLHLREVTFSKRRHLSNCTAYLFETDYFSIEMFKLAYRKFTETANDSIKDIPELWRYIFEFIGPLILKNYISMHDLSSKELRKKYTATFGTKFLKSYLQYCTYEIGPNYTRKMWKSLNLKWLDYIPENELTQFMRDNKFEYIENENLQPYMDTSESKDKRMERVNDHIKRLINEGSNTDMIVDYVKGNVAEIDKSFIRSLTVTLSSVAIKDSANPYKLDKKAFQEVCIPILLRCIDSKDILELECLYAFQFLFLNLDHPPGLLTDIFIELNNADVIQHETFRKWRDSKDQTVGKGVAVKAVNPFFNQALSGETSDDN